MAYGIPERAFLIALAAMGGEAGNPRLKGDYATRSRGDFDANASVTPKGHCGTELR